MRHRRFLARLLNRPQMITPAAGAAGAAALMPGFRLDGWSGDAATDVRDPREYQVTPARTAVIPIVGELVHRGGGMDAMSGVTSYEALQDMIVDALSDPGVSGLMLDMDTPGGEAGGVLDFAEWLAAQRGPKPIVAFVNSMAGSAGYAIASAADTILLSPDSMVGSIGVVTYHLDLSRALANEGVVVTHIYAGDRKIDGNPTEPLSDPAMAEIQGLIDTMYGRFCSVVAANRGLTQQAVRDTQAAIYQGQDAIAAGLADDIATYGEALMATAPRSAPAGARTQMLASTAKTRMSGAADNPAQEPAKPGEPNPLPAPAPEPAKPADAPAPGEPGADPADTDTGVQKVNVPHSPTFAPAEPVEVAEACAAAGFPELTAYLIRGKASMAAVKARIGEAKEIKSIAQSVNLPGMAAPFIKAGLSVEDARAALFEAKAGKDAGLRTDTTAPADRTAGATPPVDALAVYTRFNAPRSGRRAA